MSTDPLLSNNFKTWDVRLLWSVIYPSSLFAKAEGADEGDFEIYGVDRSAATISRPLTKINSLEVYGQGWQDGVPDIRVTIFTKESGTSFEQMRRLAASKIPFDIQLTLASDELDGNLENNPHEGIWIDGYEDFLGCRVTTERTNYNVAEFPVREFECVALRHRILDSTGLAAALGADFDIMIEGDGTYATTLPKK